MSGHHFIWKFEQARDALIRTARAWAAEEERRTPHRKHPQPAEEPAVRVEALAPTWCVGGRPVVPGETYTVSAGDAARLVAAGKARPA